jgi:multiple sugar transport system ATP-binding protein
MDDPLSQLDSSLRAAGHAELRMSLGTRIAVLNDGLLEQTGTPRLLYDRPASLFVAGFIGSPPMNLLPTTIQPAAPAASTRYSGRQIVVGLRPEHIHDARFFPASDPLVSLPARVELREYLGTEIYLHLNLGGTTLLARMDTRTTARPGDTLHIVPDTTYLHAFDPATHRALL